jgi:hypothetical protein
VFAGPSATLTLTSQIGTYKFGKRLQGVMRRAPATLQARTVSTWLIVLVLACAHTSGTHAWRHHSSNKKVAAVTRYPTRDPADGEVLGNGWSRATTPQPVLKEGDALSLCECEDAALSLHGGLQCEKEGWFVYSFEARGQWVRPLPAHLHLLF